jgi:hypothetical protein
MSHELSRSTEWHFAQARAIRSDNSTEAFPSQSIDAGIAFSSLTVNGDDNRELFLARNRTLTAGFWALQPSLKEFKGPIQGA